MSVINVAPATCEMHTVIRFLCPKEIPGAKIHHELCLDHESTVKKVRQWCRDFINKRTIVHDEERSDRHSFQTEEIVSEMTRSEQIEEFLIWHAPQHCHVKPRIPQIYATLVQKMLRDQYKEQRMSSERF